MRRLVSIARALLVPLLATGCASMDFERDSPETGRFTSRAVSFTFLSYDLPAPALSIARSNASDSGLPELVVEEEILFPYFWRLDWLLDIVSVRYASVSGTWGIPVETPPGSLLGPSPRDAATTADAR